MGEIRNVALVGHTGSGKTTLAEALLFKAGAIKKKGTIAEKNTVADYNPDEKDRGSSLEAAILHMDHDGTRINLIDCPGAPDFLAGSVEGMAAVETALIVVNAAAGIEVMTRKVWGMAEVRNLAKAVIITQMDHERANYEKVVNQLQECFEGSGVTPLLFPVGAGGTFNGVFNLLDDPASAPSEIVDQAPDLAQGIIENVVTADDEMMERYLSDEKFTPEEIEACFRKGLREGKLCPVLCVAAEKDLGTKEVLDILAHFTARPDAFKKTLVKGEETKELEVSKDGPFYAQVFRSKWDPFLGKISYLRVFSGSFSAGNSAHNDETGKPEKLAHFGEVQGKDSKEISTLIPGSIVAIAKNEHLNSGTTLTSEHDGFAFAPIPFPDPMQALAVEAASRKDETRISEQLRHLAESDPTFKVEVDSQTHELVIKGMGQLHLDLNLGRLKAAGVEVTTKQPKIAYRSTINGTAEVRYRHKKQSGGAGQFGEVNIVIEPNPGEGYEFLDEIVGGVIPNTLIPSVDKGIQKKMADGVWSGVQVFDVKVHLNDGKYHPVDSKDIAFQIAGRHAFSQAFEKAKPSLTEPVVKLEVVVPSQYMGDITGLVSGKRGRIHGMESLGDMQLVHAEAPLSEVQQFSGELKSITGGEGFYSMEFSHYASVPSNLAQPIIEAARKKSSGSDD